MTSLALRAALPLALLSSCSLFFDAGAGGVVGVGEGEGGEVGVVGEGEGDAAEGEGDGDGGWPEPSRSRRRRYAVVDGFADDLVDASAPVLVVVDAGDAAFYDDGGDRLAAELDSAVERSDDHTFVSRWWVRAAPSRGLVVYFDPDDPPPPPRFQPTVWGAGLVVLLHFNVDRGAADDRGGNDVFADDLAYVPVDGGIDADGSSCVALADDLRALLVGSTDVAVVVAGRSDGGGHGVISWSVADPEQVQRSRFSVTSGAAGGGGFDVIARLHDTVDDAEVLRLFGVPATSGVGAVLHDATGSTVLVIDGGLLQSARARRGFDVAAPTQAHFLCDDGDVAASRFVGRLDEFRVRVAGGAVGLDAASLALEERGLVEGGVFVAVGAEELRP